MYRGADVVAIASHNEGFGLVGIEAMASGVPVVSTGVGGMSGYMVDGENAVLVPVGHPAALAAGLNRVLDSESLREELVRGGLATAPDHSVSETAAAMARFYELVAQ